MIRILGSRDSFRIVCLRSLVFFLNCSGTAGWSVGKRCLGFIALFFFLEIHLSGAIPTALEKPKDRFIWKMLACE